MKYLILILFSSSFLTPVFGIESISVTKEYFHLRNAEPREWSHFPEKAERKELTLPFDAAEPERWKLLTVRQAETKQKWTVWLNGKKIGDLLQDHNDQEYALEIPPGIVKESGNELRISTPSKIPDDVRIGQIEIHDGTLAELTEGIKLSAKIVDEVGNPLPCRFTIVEAGTQTLVLTSEVSNDVQAVRGGVIYSLTGTLSAQVRPGRGYEIYIGRGFEYELLKFGVSDLAKMSEPFVLKKQVDTMGMVSCDTHLHTFEHARHGDCSVIERIISIAGEGLELPVSTEHDKHIDYAPEAKRLGADRYFTPVVGCEVTTRQGHFNSFPVVPNVKPAEHGLRPWVDIFRNIYNTGAEICIINHPRDLHRKFRPFDPMRWDVTTGKFTDGRKLEANGFELINSGATQTDPMQLTHDWMALLRSDHKIAAVGASDSHTVNFAIPGQARTYLKANDDDPSAIDVKAAVGEFLAGRTLVSFGLLADLKLEGEELTGTISGPDWVRAQSMTLFADGVEVETVEILEKQGRQAGAKATASWKLKDLNAKPGAFYVLVARGPGITAPWWMMMPPYQPDSPVYDPYVFAVSSAIFPDGR